MSQRKISSHYSKNIITRLSAIQRTSSGNNFPSSSHIQIRSCESKVAWVTYRSVIPAGEKNNISQTRNTCFANPNILRVWPKLARARKIMCQHYAVLLLCPFLVDSGKMFGLVYSPWERVTTSHNGSQVSLFVLRTGTATTTTTTTTSLFQITNNNNNKFILN